MMNAPLIDSRINRFWAKIRKPFRGIINLVTSKGKVQTAQVSGLSGETLQSIELFQHFGFSSAPPSGTQAILVPIGGVTTHSVIVATENSQYRIQTLNSGEVAIYNQDGASVVLKKGKVIEANCDTFIVNCKDYEVNATSGAKINTPTLQASQQFTASSIEAQSAKVNGINMDSHKHDTPDGESGPPHN